MIPQHLSGLFLKPVRAWNYTWKHGRELASMYNDSATWQFTYNADGLRVQRTNGSKTYTYVYLDGQLVKMTAGSIPMYFSYDAEGRPVSILYNGITYYYLTNLQGDIVGLTNNKGEQVVAYTYDAWGNLMSTTGSKANAVGLNNPLRYRGYLYDRETGLYYLQSRYYDPEMGRFINADSFTSTGQGILGNNMFAYCGNNPIQNTDPLGTTWFTAIIGGIIGAAVGGISAAVTGGTVTDVMIGAIAGLASGAVIGATGSLKAGKIAGRVVGASITAVGTFVDAKLNGVNTGDAIICAAVSFGVTYGVATISGFAGSDTFASSLSDIMFGLGGGLCSSAITSAAIQKANTRASAKSHHSSNKSKVMGGAYTSNNIRPSRIWEVSML